MARYLLALILVSESISLVHAQPAPIDPPIAGRPVDFSNIVGNYEIKVSAAPTVVPVEESIILRVEIIGEGPNKYQPKRSSLKIIPTSWENDFYILEMPAEDRVMRDEKTWLFVYRLKPRNVHVTAIPLMTLHYYDPTQSEKRRFQKAYGGPIPISVTSKPEPPPIVAPDIAVPESFYERASVADVGRSTPLYGLDVNRLIAWLALTPIAGVFAVWVYRRIHPGQNERARQHHNQAFQRALAQLMTAPAWNVVASYLRERFEFAALDATPAEVAAFLKRRGFALSLCRQGRAFIEACDAVRFTQGEIGASRLAEDAERLIRALEADPCTRV